MTAQPTQERLTQILAAPVVSEKSTYVADKFNQVIFEVIPDATKPEIKAAVELMFKVEVTGVRVSNTMGKSKRFGRYLGKRSDTKRAYVSIKAGQEINFTGE
jgi:large subunit ribosomal protein L23